MIDVERVRAETPGCSRVLHFNNAGAGLMPQPVLDSVVDHLRLEAEIGGYEAFEACSDTYEDTYAALARLLGAADLSEIALVENATRAWDMAFYGFRFDEGDVVITTPASYASNYLAMLHVARRFGVRIKVARTRETGEVDPDDVARLIDARTRLICLTHIPTNSGLVNPAEEVGRIARAHGVPYLLDACQSVGQVPIDVDAIGCDFLSGTGRKYLRGPRGTGFLYARTSSLDLVEPPLLDLQAATWTAENEYVISPGARRFENWEGFVAGKIGLGVAIRYALDVGIEAGWDRMRRLADALREQLRGVTGITVHDIGSVQGGIVTFSHARVSFEYIVSGLRGRGINAKTLPPEWARLDAERRALPGMVRASVHYYNTDEEVERFVGAVRELVGAG